MKILALERARIKEKRPEQVGPSADSPLVFGLLEFFAILTEYFVGIALVSWAKSAGVECDPGFEVRERARAEGKWPEHVGFE